MSLETREIYNVEVVRDAESGSILREIWRDVDGKKHRFGDAPAVTHYDPQSGLAIQFEYFWHGLEHRLNGPSLEVLDPKTRVVVLENWKNYGIYNEEIVSIINRDHNSGMVLSAYIVQNGNAKKVNLDSDGTTEFNPGPI